MTIEETGSSKKITTQEFPILPKDKAQLIVLVGRGAGRAYSLENEVLIGRTPEARIFLQSEDVSRRHAMVSQTEQGTFVLEDLGSRNGTVINGVPIKKQVLNVGDKVKIGRKTILMFSQHDLVEDQLLQSQKMESIGHLAGGISHDFNNILGAILANINFMQTMDPQATLGEQLVRDSLKDVETAVRRAVDLTKQLLGFARHAMFDEQLFNVSQLVGEVETLLARTLQRKITIQSNIEPYLMVKGDASQIHQVLMNLCLNASDAMPQGGQLTLVVESAVLKETDVLALPFLLPGSYVILSITDTGSGMDEATRRRVFEPFFTTKGPSKGTGMGLATTYGIVKRHGGHITVASTPGQGSTFKIYLPAAEPDEECTAPVLTSRSGTRKIARGLILVVDDEVTFRNGACRLLENLGYGTLEAKDGIEALERFEEHQEMIELVLLDLVMPNLDGIETFHELRKIKPTIKILLSSGFTDQDRARALLSAGARGFLQKPYDAESLSKAISSAMFELAPTV